MKGCCGCGGPLTLLGRLGFLTWFRCRNCGLNQYKKRKPKCPKK